MKKVYYILNKFIEKYWIPLFFFIGFIIIRKTFLVYFGIDLNVVHEDLTLFNSFKEYKDFLFSSFNEYYEVNSIRTLYYFVFLIGRYIYIFPIFVWVAIALLGVSFFYSTKKILFEIFHDSKVDNVLLFAISFLYLFYFAISKGHHFYHIIIGAVLFPLQFYLLLSILNSKTNIFKNSNYYLLLFFMMLGGSIHHLFLLILTSFVSIFFWKKKAIILLISMFFSIAIVLFPSYLYNDPTATTPLNIGMLTYPGSISEFIISPFERFLLTENEIGYNQEIIFNLIFFPVILTSYFIFFVRKKKQKKILFLKILLVLSTIATFGLNFKFYEFLIGLLKFPILDKIVYLGLNIFRFPTRFFYLAIFLSLFLFYFYFKDKIKINFITISIIIISIFTYPFNIVFNGSLGNIFMPKRFERIIKLPDNSKVVYYPNFVSTTLDGSWITQEFLILNNGYKSIETSYTGGTYFNMIYSLLPYYLSVNEPDTLEYFINDYYTNWKVDYVVYDKRIKTDIENGYNINDIFHKSDLEQVFDDGNFSVYKVNTKNLPSKVYFGEIFNYWQEEMYSKGYIYGSKEILEKNIEVIDTNNLPMIDNKRILSGEELYKIFGINFLKIKKIYSSTSCLKDLKMCALSDAGTLILNREQFIMVHDYLVAKNQSAKISYHKNDNKYYMHYYTNGKKKISLNSNDFNVTYKYIFILLTELILLVFCFKFKIKKV